MFVSEYIDTVLWYGKVTMTGRTPSYINSVGSKESLCESIFSELRVYSWYTFCVCTCVRLCLQMRTSPWIGVSPSAITFPDSAVQSLPRIQRARRFKSCSDAVKSVLRLKVTLLLKVYGRVSRKLQQTLRLYIAVSLERLVLIKIYALTCGWRLTPVKNKWYHNFIPNSSLLLKRETPVVLIYI